MPYNWIRFWFSDSMSYTDVVDDNAAKMAVQGWHDYNSGIEPKPSYTVTSIGGAPFLMRVQDVETITLMSVDSYRESAEHSARLARIDEEAARSNGHW